MRLRAILPLLLVLGILCLGFGTKKPPLTIRFYTETTQQDTESFASPITLLNGQQAYLNQIAVLSEHDILAIYPFTAADGTCGCALKFDTHGTIQLDSVSNEKRGSVLIASINERQVADILIDARVTDGIITIPSGITPLEMKAMQKKYPILGKQKKKAKSKYDEGLIGT